MHKILKDFRLWLILVLLVLIVAGTVFVLRDKCSTTECFTNKANKCEPVQITQEDDRGNRMFFEQENCVVTKRYTKFSKIESDLVIEWLSGKEMKCSYEKGAFNEELLEGIRGGIILCEGELAEAITDMDLYLAE